MISGFEAHELRDGLPEDMGVIDNWLMTNHRNRQVRFQQDVGSLNKMDSSIVKALEGVMEHFECPICCCPLEKPKQTACGHVFCGDCLNKVANSRSGTNSNISSMCPLCKARISTRGLIERNDLEDMRVLVGKLGNIFKKEFNNFRKQDSERSNPKREQRDKNEGEARFSRHGELASNPSLQRKVGGVQMKNGTATEEEKDYFDKAVGKQLVDAAAGKKKNTNDLEKAIQRNQKEKIQDKLLNQNYVIQLNSIVPEQPLDLSLSRNKSSKSPVYKFSTAVKFVKPLDLSMKGAKRKLEEFPASSQTTFQDANNKRRRTIDDRITQRKKQSSYYTSSPTTANETAKTLKPANAIDIVDITNSDIIISSDDIFQKIPENPTSTSFPKNKQIHGSSNTVQNARRDLVFKEPNKRETQINKNEFVKEPSQFEISVFEAVAHGEEFNQPTDSDAMLANLSDSLFLATKAVQPSTDEQTGTDTKKVNLDRRNENTEGVMNNVTKEKEFEKPSNEKAKNLVKNVVEQRKNNNNDDSYFGFDDLAFDDDDSWMGQATSGKRYVFCPSRLNKNQMVKLQELCQMCKGEISREFTAEVTHLVIHLSNGRVPQTLKYLLAIAGRKWVVIFDWVDNCIEKGEMLAEVAFETSNFKQCDPGVRSSRLSKTDLFKGFNFYFASCDNVKKKFGFTWKEVLMLMETLGAKIYESQADFPDESVIIIGTPNENETEYYTWFHTKNWITITFEYVIECILEYKLQAVEKKHLCIDVPENDLQSAYVPKPLQLILKTRQK